MLTTYRRHGSVLVSPVCSAGTTARSRWLLPKATSSSPRRDRSQAHLAAAQPGWALIRSSCKSARFGPRLSLCTPQASCLFGRSRRAVRGSLDRALFLKTRAYHWSAATRLPARGPAVAGGAGRSPRRSSLRPRALGRARVRPVRLQAQRAARLADGLDEHFAGGRRLAVAPPREPDVPRR